MNDRSHAKRRALVEILRSYRRVLVAYSGGVDSSFLAAVAHESLGRGATCVTAVSPSLARVELEEAKALATDRGWDHKVLRTRELEREEYAANGMDRCYWCKSELFDVMAPVAVERGARIVVGTNVDDLSDHRPGLRAAEERGIASPLVEAGLTKAEVRALSAELGLPTAEKPAAPCLSSRIAYGVRVTAPRLRRIERAESFIHSLGFDVVRVRDMGLQARVEVGRQCVERALALEAEIARELLSLGYERVVVDPQGYQMGSMNELPIAGISPA